MTPADTTLFVISERYEGTKTTDFGAPDIAPSGDRRPVDQAELERFQTILQAAWQAFDEVVQRVTGKELRKGPRGGGRDLAGIVQHVLDADVSYLRRLAWKVGKGDGESQSETLTRTRQAVLDALAAAVRGEIPERGPRGGVIWRSRYFVRRVAWHLLDHLWEIEDRVI